MKKGLIKIGFICCLFLLQSCTRPPAPARIVLEEYSIDNQQMIGDAINSEIVNNPSKYNLLSETEYSSAYHYLNTLFRTLLTTETVNRRDELDWKLTILQDDSRKGVFTAPGGRIFIYTGFLKFIRTENEFLSVLAHEIYYTDSDIAMKRLANKVEDAGAVFGDIVLGKQVANISDIACTVRDLSFSDPEIKAADNFSIELLCNFQYDALGLKDLLVEANTLSMPIDWISTRPSSEERLENIMLEASVCGTNEATLEERYQKFLNDLP